MPSPAPSQPPFRAAPPVEAPRAKHLSLGATRTERPNAGPQRAPYWGAALLDVLMSIHSFSNVALAEYLGVDERVVRGLRDGSRPLTLARVRQMPAELRDALLEETKREAG